MSWIQIEPFNKFGLMDHIRFYEFKLIFSIVNQDLKLNKKNMDPKKFQLNSSIYQ